jgi:signal transduction histidine kinase/ligand-binding sensor domain-containing protein
MGRVRPWLAAVLVLLATTAHASGPGDDLSVLQFRHTAWTADSVVPSHLNQILQTRDGYLWIASVDGLSRFDGVTFETFSPANDDPRATYSVVAMMESRAGEIWVGLGGEDAVTIFRHGRFASAHMPNPAQSVVDLAEDLDGAVWVANARPVNGLSRFANGRWDEPGRALGMPDGWIFSLLVTRDGTLWVSTMDKVVFLRRGARRFELADARVQSGGALAEDGAGHVWLSDRAGTRRLRDPGADLGAERHLPNYPATGLVRRAKITFSPDGALWGTSGSFGLFRIAHPDANGVVTTFSEKDGLTDDQTNAVFADREGTVWVGGTRGLNAFVRPSLVEDSVIPDGANEYGTAVDARGSVYIREDGAVFMIRPAQAPRAVRQGLSDGFGLCASRAGGVWLIHQATAEELIDGRTVRSIALQGGEGVHQCAEDGTGTLWVASEGGVLKAHDRTGWRDESGRLGDGFVDNLSIDSQGRLVIGNAYRSVMRVDGDRTTSWSADQMGLSQLTFSHDGPLGLIAAGPGGLARLRDGRIERLTTQRHPWLRKTRWMLETPDGEVWLFTYANIVRLRATDMDQAFAHPDRPIPHRVFDALDGLTSGSDRISGARAARGSDGRLWFLGIGGVMRLDPSSLSTNTIAPPVLIRALIAGNDPVQLSELVRLPAGVSALQIDYTALSLRTPSRVRFRYRLVGVDTQWINAGDRRSAYYNSLRPGTYRFEVTAANDDGVWNPTGATMSITIPPMFWQTGWFVALCFLAFAVGSWFLYRLRLHTVTARIRSGLGERLAERERIARELHDTLLQGVQGLILRFQLIAEELPRNRPQRGSMEAALDAADEVLGQARDRVQDLRMTDLEGGDLEAALAKLALDDAAGDPPTGVFVEGVARPLERIAGDELIQIVREALSNARRHAKARCIEIRVRYAHRLTVSVIDDGDGMPAEVVRDGRPGHFGLTGMRERARRIQARIKVESAPAAGTRILITTPGRVAYAQKPGRRLIDRIRRLIRG